MHGLFVKNGSIYSRQRKSWSKCSEISFDLNETRSSRLFYSMWNENTIFKLKQQQLNGENKEGTEKNK